MTTTSASILVVPNTTLRYRLENEAACLEYLAGTRIPVPALRGIFQDDGVVYLITEYNDGIPVSELGPADKEVVMKELEQHIAIYNISLPCGHCDPQLQVFRGHHLSALIMASS
jgi:aminoglycoside phosphotransferase